MGFDGRGICTAGQEHDHAVFFHPSLDLHGGDLVTIFLSSETGELRLISTSTTRTDSIQRRLTQLNNKTSQVLVENQTKGHSENVEEQRKRTEPRGANLLSELDADDIDIDVEYTLNPAGGGGRGGSTTKKSSGTARINPFALSRRATWFGVIELRGSCLQVTPLLDDNTVFNFATRINSLAMMNSKAHVVARMRKTRLRSEYRFARLQQLGAPRSVYMMLQARQIELRAPRNAKSGAFLPRRRLHSRRDDTINPDQEEDSEFDHDETSTEDEAHA